MIFSFKTISWNFDTNEKEEEEIQQIQLGKRVSKVSESNKNKPEKGNTLIKNQGDQLYPEFEGFGEEEK